MSRVGFEGHSNEDCAAAQMCRAGSNAGSGHLLETCAHDAATRRIASSKIGMTGAEQTTCTEVRDALWQMAGLDPAQARARFPRYAAHLRGCAACRERLAVIALVAAEDADGVLGPPAFPVAKSSRAAVAPDVTMVMSEPVQIARVDGRAVFVHVSHPTEISRAHDDAPVEVGEARGTSARQIVVCAGVQGARFELRIDDGAVVMLAARAVVATPRLSARLESTAGAQQTGEHPLVPFEWRSIGSLESGLYHVIVHELGAAGRYAVAVDVTLT